ncbi:uncharacterized protein LOC133038503 [Cannabis sativa]|uniref:uncharacterized protein LOC133038503 n=1 Tax=Cannabis sativa TaxID=3483 RepID=UPI0029CA873C|nr:uncharacterized protein LOC133038503 [Cannabis sativa]
MEAEALVIAGARRSVGAGLQIDVLHDPWLPNIVNPYVISSHLGLGDRAMEFESSPEGAVFLWETNVLPSCDQLAIKHVVVSTTCPMCNNSVETTFHVLVGCSFARSRWFRSSVDIGSWGETDFKSWWRDLSGKKKYYIPPSSLTISAPVSSFMDWCTSTFSQVIADKKYLIAVVYWAIWSARNKVVWKGKTAQADNIVVFAKNYLSQWNNAQKTVLGSSCSETNDDVALFDGGRSFRTGVVARDEKGWLIEGRITYTSSTVEPVLAEAISVKEVLTWIKCNQWQHVTVESNCLGVVQIPMISLFGQVIQSCKTLLAELCNVKVIFINRSANVVTHNFTRVSNLYLDRTFNLKSILTDLLPCLVTEFVGW